MIIYANIDQNSRGFVKVLNFVGLFLAAINSLFIKDF